MSERETVPAGELMERRWRAARERAGRAEEELAVLRAHLKAVTAIADMMADPSANWTDDVLRQHVEHLPAFVRRVPVAAPSRADERSEEVGGGC